MTSDKELARFWSKVNKAGDNDCWEWQAFVDPKSGYGYFWRPYDSRLAHRAAYEYATGNHPGEMLVMHSCDNRVCCNPNHLSLGTYLDNNRDRENKGRSAKLYGEKSHKAKLSNSDARAIRSAYAQGGTSYRKLARLYGVSYITINRVINEDTFKYV